MLHTLNCLFPSPVIFSNGISCKFQLLDHFLLLLTHLCAHFSRPLAQLVVQASQSLSIHYTAFCPSRFQLRTDACLSFGAEKICELLDCLVEQCEELVVLELSQFASSLLHGLVL